MGCGKTKAGKQLASLIRRPFADSDQVFESTWKMSISDFFRKEGESRFRELESALLKEICPKGDAVVALGGGTPCFHDNMAWIREHGCSVYLRMNELALLQRICCSRHARPLMDSLTSEEKLDRICEQLAEREPHYLQADLIWPGINLSIPALWEKLQPILLEKEQQA